MMSINMEILPKLVEVHEDRLSVNLLYRVLLCSLQEVAAVDGLYRIRVPRVSLQADRLTERPVEGHLSAFVRAVRSSLRKHNTKLYLVLVFYLVWLHLAAYDVHNVIVLDSAPINE